MDSIMTMILEYIKKIAYYIVITGFIAVLVPDNSFKKYIVFISGALLILIVMEPIFVLIGELQ